MKVCSQVSTRVFLPPFAAPQGAQKRLQPEELIIKAAAGPWGTRQMLGNLQGLLQVSGEPETDGRKDKEYDLALTKQEVEDTD